jgi:hypothetical protein
MITCCLAQTKTPTKEFASNGFSILSPPGGQSSIKITDSANPTAQTTAQKEWGKHGFAVLKPPGGQSSNIFG